jgi:hypothetical protein
VNQSFNLTTAERIESLKAGILAGLSLVLAYGITTVGNSLVLVAQVEALAPLQITTVVNLLVRMAIAFLSGFLFGVTYRYVIRDDKNPHLKSGAVLAFGLVRGLAPVEVEQNLTDSFWVLSVLGVESILYFAIARFTLDWAMHHKWVKPFRSN